MTTHKNIKSSQPFQDHIRYGSEPTTLEEMQDGWKARQVRYAQAAEACRQASLPPPPPPSPVKGVIGPALPPWTAPPPPPPLFPIPPRVEVIQTMVCSHFGIGRLDMLSNRRSTDMVLPRHLAIYLCRMLTFRSLHEIGLLFRRDHSTILHAVDHIKRQRPYDEILDASILMLTDQLRP